MRRKHFAHAWSFKRNQGGDRADARLETVPKDGVFAVPCAKRFFVCTDKLARRSTTFSAIERILGYEDICFFGVRFSWERQRTEIQLLQQSVKQTLCSVEIGTSLGGTRPK